jgi:hypothetical protein
LERFFKSYFLAKDPLGLSAIDPNTYQDRFMQVRFKIPRLGDLSALLFWFLSLYLSLFFFFWCLKTRACNLPFSVSTLFLSLFWQRVGDIMNLTEESMGGSGQRSARASLLPGECPRDDSMVLLPPGIDRSNGGDGSDGSDDDDNEAAVLLPAISPASGSFVVLPPLVMTREELRSKQVGARDALLGRRH